MNKMPKAPPYFDVVELKQLKAHPDGVRTSTAESVYRLRKSYEAFGLLRPLVLNLATGWVLDGDKVLSVLRAAGVEKVPVWCVEVPEHMEDAAHLALNNHAGEWQWQPVSGLLKRLQELKVDMGLTGFHDSDTGPLVAADWSPVEKGPLDGTDPAQSTMF